MALFEWGLTPEYINQNWTEELLHLMLTSRNQRHGIKEADKGPNTVSNADFFAATGIQVERR